MYDYVIVGSGLSGLNTARLLSEKYNNKKICILEKNKRIGGLIQTKHFTITKLNMKQVGQYYLIIKKICSI